MKNRLGGEKVSLTLSGTFECLTLAAAAAERAEAVLGVLSPDVDMSHWGVLSWPGSLMLVRLRERELLLREVRPDMSMLMERLVEYDVPELWKLPYRDWPGGSCPNSSWLTSRSGLEGGRIGVNFFFCFAVEVLVAGMERGNLGEGTGVEVRL